MIGDMTSVKDKSVKILASTCQKIMDLKQQFQLLVRRVLQFTQRFLCGLVRKEQSDKLKLTPLDYKIVVGYHLKKVRAGSLNLNYKMIMDVRSHHLGLLFKEEIYVYIYIYINKTYLRLSAVF